MIGQAFIIQACQRPNQRKPASIRLRRAHTALLHATVAESTARRGLFTGELSKCILNSDKPMTLPELHQQAVGNMENEEQTPKLESTLKKWLKLPWSHFS